MKWLINTQMDNRLAHRLLGSSSTDQMLSWEVADLKADGGPACLFHNLVRTTSRYRSRILAQPTITRMTSTNSYTIHFGRKSTIYRVIIADFSGTGVKEGGAEGHQQSRNMSREKYPGTNAFLCNVKVMKRKICNSGSQATRQRSRFF